MPNPHLLSGVKPTGDPHLGNYFGAMRQFVTLQDRYDCFIFIADLHALNQVHDPSELRRSTDEVVKTYLSIGLDPAKVTLFRQSDVPVVTELAWILGTVASMGMLERAHAYKDALAKGKAVNAGLFTYPVLMAADILLYRAAVVPVGKDQQQHLEMTVDLAQRFNHLYGETFTIPKALIGDTEVAGDALAAASDAEVAGEAGVVVGLDGRKMSKSYGNVIGLFDDPETLRRKVMSIKTDSRTPEEPKDPDTCTVFAFHRLVTPEPALSDLATRYRQGGVSYKESKEKLVESLSAYLAPIQTKRAALDADPGYVMKVLEEGAAKALESAGPFMEEIKRKVGLRG